MSKNILSIIAEKIRGEAPAIFEFDYVDKKTKATKRRVVEVVTDISRRYKENNYVPKGKENWVSEANAYTEGIFPDYIVIRNENMYLRVFPTALDASGWIPHDKLFLVDDIMNIHPLAPGNKIITGNLVKLAKEGRFDVLIHGCNCFHTMGSGIAAKIREEWPEAYVSDHDTTTYGDANKLGDYSFAVVGPLTIVNGYTQFGFGRNSTNPDGGPVLDIAADYFAIRSLMRKIRRDFPGKRIGLPFIGCGLAGGDKGIILPIIAEELVGLDYTIVEFDPTA